MCCLWVIPFGGDKHINQNPQKIPGKSDKILVLFFCLCWFVLPQTMNQMLLRDVGIMLGNAEVGIRWLCMLSLTIPSPK